MATDMATTIAFGWIILWCVGGGIIIACALLRCRKCRGWHDSEEDDEKCGQNEDDWRIDR